MTEQLDELVEHIGILPREGAPAAWWYCRDTATINNYRGYERDRANWFERFQRFAEAHAARTDAASTWSSWNGTVRLRGLTPRDVRSIPDGWRYDAKAGVMVPRRKTKAERDSEIVRDFTELENVPSWHSYVQNIPPAFWGNRSVHPVDIRMLDGASALVAFCSGDPDQVDTTARRRDFPIDHTVWTRLPLSTFHLIREHQTTAAVTS